MKMIAQRVLLRDPNHVCYGIWGYLVGRRPQDGAKYAIFDTDNYNPNMIKQPRFKQHFNLVLYGPEYDLADVGLVQGV